MLHYQVTGDPRKPAILFLHGFLGNHAEWGEVIERIASAYHCVAIDLPGHGRSVALETPEAYGIVQTADAIIEVADEVRLDHFSLVGYSMGGRVALYFASVFAMRLDCLVLESASPGLKTAAERDDRRRRDERWGVEFEAATSDTLPAVLEKWYAQPIFESLRGNPDRYAALMDRRRQNQPAELARSLRAVGTGSQPSLWGDLASHTMPTLLITGTLDTKFQAIGREMVARCPAMHLAILPECGHNVHFENPAGYTDVLNKFVRGA